jgi:hypothetical protein
MSLVVVTLKQVDGALPLTGRLAAEVAAGALTYLVVAVAPQRQRVRSVLATFRRQAR